MFVVKSETGILWIYEPSPNEKNSRIIILLIKPAIEDFKNGIEMERLSCFNFIPYAELTLMKPDRNSTRNQFSKNNSKREY
ncbi:hypothetical protein LEP1GSC165_2370 [Leptospira santarosai str. CBC523]|nr:hypothetical protein LEP1GSC165_2370 [Leptospira santarosai str. CBC523]